jgi:glutamyl-tRNA synthetase
MNEIRTRIAPSPTGENLHIGNAYTALINYVFAGKMKGKFIIRIEDTDRTRLVEGSEKRILESLEWLCITHSEGPDIGGQFEPYRQSERLPVYKKYVEELIEKGHAYYCFCTSARLDEMRQTQEKSHVAPMYDGLCKGIPLAEAKIRVANGEKYVVRLNVPEEGTTTFHDVVRGDISFENKLIDDQVLLKSDGFPTYHLAVVVDDHLMKITHVIRGEEWISSTPKHILLYDFLGWEKPVYAHMSVLRNPDRTKLSKRRNPVWVSWFKEQGFLPEAILNFLGTLAWTYPKEKEIFTVSEMMEAFRLEDVQATAPIFNIEKLRWFNGEYLRRKSDDELLALIYQHVNVLTREYEPTVRKILPLIRDRMKVLSEFESLAGFFFTRPATFENPLEKSVISALHTCLGSAEWDHDSMEHTIRELTLSMGKKPKDVFMQLRVAVTGKTVGPPLLESLEILGKKETLERLGTPQK